MAGEGSSSAPGANQYAARGMLARHPKGKFAIGGRDPADVVRFGELSQEEADGVWRAALGDWGIAESTERDRDELTAVVAHALVVSTSKDDENLDTRFMFKGVYHTLRPLAERAMVHSPGKNDTYLRMFVRSFRYGLLPCAMSDMLGDPSNVELRQEMAMRCGGPVEHAYLMIDTLGGAIKLSGRIYSAAELELYTRYRTNRTSAAQRGAQDIGLSTSRNDTSGRSSHSSDVKTMPAKADASVRTGFAPAALR